MSGEATAWAITQNPGRMADKMVLLGYANGASPTGVAYASIAYLCEFGCMDAKTVNASVKRLVEAGYLNPTGDKVGRTGQIHVYQLAMERTAETTNRRNTNNTKNGKVTRNGKVTVFSEKPPQKRNTETSKETLVESASALPTKRARNAPALPAGVSAEQWGAFVEMRQRIRAPLTENAKTLLLAKLQRLADAGQPPGDVLDQSTMNSWRGIFELKGETNGRLGRQAGTERPQRDAGPTNPRVLAFARMAGHLPPDDGTQGDASRCDATGAPAAGGEYPGPARLALSGFQHH